MGSNACTSPYVILYILLCEDRNTRHEPFLICLCGICTYTAPHLRLPCSHTVSLAGRRYFRSMAPPIVVAIDFGTTRSAWAYTVSGQAESGVIVKVPDGVASSESSTFKTETAVLLGNEGRGGVVAFGPAALKRVVQGQHKDNEALFRWFKVGLLNTGGHTSAGGLMVSSTESTGGRRVPLLGVVTASLRYFKDDVLGYLSSLVGSRIYAKDVDWVLTVPAIYNDFAKLFMRQAAHEAGMIDRVNSSKLRLCLEPEAACVWVTTGDNPYPLTTEAVGKQIMILDCGGGTVDITTHRVRFIDPLSLAEESQPGGGPWGSTFVDEEFKQWLTRFLGDRFRDVADSEELFSIMIDWEREKAAFQGPDSEPLLFNLVGLCEYGMTSVVLKVGPSANVECGHFGRSSHRVCLVGGV